MQLLGAPRVGVAPSPEPSPTKGGKESNCGVGMCAWLDWWRYRVQRLRFAVRGELGERADDRLEFEGHHVVAGRDLHRSK